MWQCVCVFVRGSAHKHTHTVTHSSSLGIICNNCSPNNPANRGKGQVREVNTGGMWRTAERQERKTKRTTTEAGGKQGREVRARCRLSPLVSAVVSRMDDPLLHRTGHLTLSTSPLFPSFLKAQGLPGGVEFLSNYVHKAATDSCIVPVQQKQHVVHNNRAPLTVFPEQNKGGTLIKAICGALYIIGCYVIFTVRSCPVLIAGLWSRVGVGDKSPFTPSTHLLLLTNMKDSFWTDLYRARLKCLNLTLVIS